MVSQINDSPKLYQLLEISIPQSFIEDETFPVSQFRLMNIVFACGE